MKILITGAKGYIAQKIKIKYPDAIAIGREECDLTSKKNVDKWFKNKHFDVVIHTAITGGSRLKTEDSSVLDNNLRMYYNLIDNKEHYDKFINIGSGADYYGLNTFYGLSKKTIAKSLSDKPNHYNLKIFAVFDHDELDTRFIKNNLKQYVLKNPLIIHKNKAMDFMYMPDFLQILDRYVYSNNLPSNIDCVYEKKYSLIDIAQIINKLDNHESDIHLQHQLPDMPYTGEYQDIGLKYIGLEQGILETYNYLKDTK